MSDVEGISRGLNGSPTPAAVILEHRELLPADHGFYAWWSGCAVADVPRVPHPLDGSLTLLYVGISPVRAASRQTVRSRVVGNHLKGNIGSSTFRLTLAAFLIDELRLQPFIRGSKPALSAADNARLSDWQHDHLQLAWLGRQAPWEIEDRVIAELAPPLNAAGNAEHPFYPRVRAARAELRQRATRLSAGGLEPTEA